MLKFKASCDLELVAISDWLLGNGTDEPPSNWRFRNWNHSKRRLSSLLAWHQREVLKFGLGRSYHTDIVNDSGSIQQEFIDRVIESNKLRKLLENLFERDCVTGQAFLMFSLDKDRLYRLYPYDKTEVLPWDSGGEKGYQIQVKTKDGYKRKIVTDKAYYKFNSSKNPHSLWGDPIEVDEHKYGFVPMVEFQHKVKIDGDAQPEYNWLSIEMALEICSQLIAAAANYTYFGGPFIVSSDPRNTLQELLDRRQVLTGRNSNDFQDTALLKMDSMPSDHPQFVDGLSARFADYHGLSWVPDRPSGDLSSLALRLLYTDTINTSESIFSAYIDSLHELIQLLLKAGFVDSVVGYKEVELETRFSTELFPPTPVEKQSLLGVAEQLISMGVRTEIALREYFPNLTTDEIADILLGG